MAMIRRMSNKSWPEASYELSVIVPIFNGEKYIKQKLESLKGIEGVNYEVIIALNKSADKSEELVDLYSQRIPNLTIIRQSSYLSGLNNYYCGYRVAKGDFIMASAVDDICDKNFYREAIDIMKANNGVCAVSPVTRFSDDSHGNKPIDFELVGTEKERLECLFENIRVSHGIFYSLMRKEIAADLNSNYFKDYQIIGADWLFDIKLALKGEVYRTKNSKCVFGVDGVSKNKEGLIYEGSNWIKEVFPYWALARNILKLTLGQDRKVTMTLSGFAMKLLKGNLHRFYHYHRYGTRDNRVID